MNNGPSVCSFVCLLFVWRRAEHAVKHHHPVNHRQCRAFISIGKCTQNEEWLYIISLQRCCIVFIVSVFGWTWTPGRIGFISTRTDSFQNKQQQRINVFFKWNLKRANMLCNGSCIRALTQAITRLFHLSAAWSHLPWNSRLFPPYAAMFCQVTLARSALSKFHYGMAEGTLCCSLRPSAWHVTVCSTQDAGGRIA